MSYIDDLRACVEHKPLILAGASVLVLDGENRLLRVRRSDTGDWGVPGGTVELGETVEETARRELREETNLEAVDLELFDIFSGPEQYYTYTNGDQVYNVSVVYFAHGVTGSLNTNDGENAGPEYFDLSLPPDNVGLPIRPILSKLAERIKG